MLSSGRAGRWSLGPFDLAGEPELVGGARRLAAVEGFQNFCIPEVGRLLHVLAASVRNGIVGELGTGCGVGAAWMVSALSRQVPFLTVDSDARLASRVRELFADEPQVTVLHGDWQQLLDYGPFALLFVDVAAAKDEGARKVVQSLATGGIAVLDDFTPPELWTEEQRQRWQVDPVRVRWLEDRRLAAIELRVRPDHSVIVAVRR